MINYSSTLLVLLPNALRSRAGMRQLISMKARRRLPLLAKIPRFCAGAQWRMLSAPAQGFLHIRGGYSIVEVLVSIAVLMLAIVGPMTIASKGLQNAKLAEQQTTAQYLAQEGIELMYAARDGNALRALDDQHGGDPWSNWTSTITTHCAWANGCRLDLSGGNLIIDQCDDGFSDCRMHLESTGRYHSRGISAGGTPTAYTRRVFTTQAVDQVHVRSVVSWTGQGGTARSVELQAVLANVYETSI